MKAIIFKAPYEIELTEIDIPKIEPDEVLVAVKAAGICGTDVHVYEGDFIADYPVVPGHEFAGEVVEVGSKVSEVKSGDRVAIDPSIYCQKCKFCRENIENFCENFMAYGLHKNGGFEEHVAVNQRNIYQIEGLSYLEGAMVEPLGCVIHGLKQIDLKLGDHILIFGCGPIGLLLMQACNIYGAASTTVVDVVKDKLDIAEQLGATNSVYADDKLYDKLREIQPDGFHIVIDATGNPEVVENCFDYVRNKGQILFFGVCPQQAKIQISPYDVYKRELKISGTFALLHTARPAIDLLQEKKIQVEPLISHEFPLEEFESAFELKQKGEAMKIVVTN